MRLDISVCVLLICYNCCFKTIATRSRFGLARRNVGLEHNIYTVDTNKLTRQFEQSLLTERERREIFDEGQRERYREGVEEKEREREREREGGESERENVLL